MNDPLAELRDDLFDAALSFGRAEQCCGRLLIEALVYAESRQRSVAAAHLLEICRKITNMVDKK